MDGCWSEQARMTSSPAAGDVEKQDNIVGASSSTSEDHSHHGHHGAHLKERLRHFLHPNGKRVHIAASPEEALSLRNRLQQIHTEDEFDIFISGTPEHLEALRKAQTHHEDRRAKLREEHPEMFGRFEHVHNELDSLAMELDRVTKHGVSLDAHFNRFGYNAHVRTYDDDGSPSASGASTPHGGSVSDKSSTSACERGFATPLKLFKVPTLRQYFHKGILWRASGSEEVQSFELFVDLLYVGILQIQGDATSADPTGLSLLHFIITFTLSYKIWNDMQLFISWFETDDVFQRVSILFLLACIFGFTTNIVEAFEITYPTLIGFYLAARLYMACYLALCGYLLPNIRGVIGFHIIITLIGVALWIGSVHVSWPGQLALIWTALFVDFVGQMAYVLVQMLLNVIGGKSREWFDSKFQFIPAVNIEHRTERTNAFVSLVFGYTVVAILYQSSHNGIDAFFGKAMLGLIQCFIFNWMYFEIDSSNLLIHAIRRHKISALTWSLAHLPFIMMFVLGGGGLSRLVVAHDSPDSHLHWLTEEYQERSEAEISVGIRWFYCAGFGIALLCMAVISITHVHKEHEGIRLTKKFRLVARLAIAVVIICLPLAHSLNSLDLVGTVTGLLVLLLGTELWAASNAHEKLFGRDRECRYTGRCSKGKLMELLQHGRDIEIEHLVSEKDKEGGHTVGP